jgi:asparagine synthetase A
MTEFVGWQEYTIMRSDTAGKETVDAAIALRKAAEAKLGTQMTLETDWVKRGEEPPVGTKEILIGATNRPESSATALLYNDYVIEKIGERVVINGGSRSAVLAGVNWFIENCITDGTMQVPAAPYRFHGEYPMAQVMVGGVKLSDYALTGDERETAYVREHPTACIMQIGGKLRSGKPHGGRAPDYDDWQLNCDIFFWDDVLGRALELSSMGIRVDAESLDRQLSLAGCDNRRELPFHKMLLNNELPLTIGGGIGQSRLCLLMMGCAHIGEVQSSVWDAATVEACEKAGIRLL